MFRCYFDVILFLQNYPNCFRFFFHPCVAHYFHRGAIRVTPGLVPLYLFQPMDVLFQKIPKEDSYLYS